MPQAELPKLARDMKQCQYCYASDTKEAPLRSCSQCKRANVLTTACVIVYPRSLIGYWSLLYEQTRDCQKKDWSVHKKMCVIMTESRKNYKDAARENETKALLGMTTSEAENKTKRWVQFYRPLLLASVKHALKLQTEEPLFGHCLSFTLAPKFTAANVPRTDDDLISAFKAENILVRPIKQWTEDYPFLVPMFESVSERERGLAGREDFLCLATVLITIPAIDTTRFVPFGIYGPRECLIVTSNGRILVSLTPGSLLSKEDPA